MLKILRPRNLIRLSSHDNAIQYKCHDVRSKGFRYKNHLSSDIDPIRIHDCQVFRDNN